MRKTLDLEYELYDFVMERLEQQYKECEEKGGSFKQWLYSQLHYIPQRPENTQGLFWIFKCVYLLSIYLMLLTDALIFRCTNETTK